MNNQVASLYKADKQERIDRPAGWRQSPMIAANGSGQIAKIWNELCLIPRRATPQSTGSKQTHALKRWRAEENHIEQENFIMQRTFHRNRFTWLAYLSLAF